MNAEIHAIALNILTHGNGDPVLGAQFDRSSGTEVDANGDVQAADSSTGRVRQLTSDREAGRLCRITYPAAEDTQPP